MSIKKCIVIPMAGLGSRFVDYGFKTNKYLLPINLKLDTMISSAINTLVSDDPIDSNEIMFIFITRSSSENKEIKNILKDICLKNNYFNYHIHNIKYLTEGPASTVYLIKDFIYQNNLQDTEFIVSNSDQILDFSAKKFYEKCSKYDGLVLTYKPNYSLVLGSLDKHSFVKFNQDQQVIDVQEKIVLSNTALVRVHYYKTAKIFFSGYEYMYNKNIRAPNNEFYLSLVYKCMLELGLTVGTCLLEDNEHFYPVGEPLDYFNYLNKINSECKISVRKYSDYEKISEDIIINSFEKNTIIQRSEFKNILILKGSCLLDNKIIGQGHIVTEKIDICSIKFIEDSIILNFKRPNEPNYSDKQNYSDEPNELHGSEKDILGIYHRDDFIRGWIVGFFKESIFQTNVYEIGFMYHKKDEKWDYHIHKLADETNILISGSMMVNGIHISSNSIFIISRNQISCPIFLTDCKVLCIKTPSIKNDKYVI
jgi:dTDP-glucose pyrophosphorylase